MEIGFSGRPDVIADRPGLMPARRRAIRTHSSVLGQNVDLGRDIARLVRVVAVRLNLREHEDLRSIPPMHADSAVLTPVDVDRAARVQSLLADLAEALSISIPVAPIPTLVEPVLDRTIRIGRVGRAPYALPEHGRRKNRDEQYTATEEQCSTHGWRLPELLN